MFEEWKASGISRAVSAFATPQLRELRMQLLLIAGGLIVVDVNRAFVRVRDEGKAAVVLTPEAVDLPRQPTTRKPHCARQQLPALEAITE